MYCVIQFYYQLRFDLAPHRPFLKVAAIKLVIFLSFWQSFLISILTSSTFNVVKTTAKVAYPDLKVGIPSLLICIEMAIFAILHLFAFPWKPYKKGSEGSEYPLSPTGSLNKPGMNQGGFLGIKALMDAMNPWDLVKGFARGMRWLFVGVKKRENDPSYKQTSFANPSNENDLTLESTGADPSYKGAQGLPIADEFRRSKFGLPGFTKVDEEGAGLIAHAQPNPLNPGSGYIPARQRYDANGQDISQGGTQYEGAYSEQSPDRLIGQNPTPGTIRRQEQAGDIGMAVSAPPEPYQSHFQEEQIPHTSQPTGADHYREQLRQARRQEPNPSQQWANSSRPNQPPPEVHNALWGQQPQQGRQNEF
jgi:Organic solute transporter Ostalpha